VGGEEARERLPRKLKRKGQKRNKNDQCDSSTFFAVERRKRF